MKRNHKSERGQALIIIAFGLVAMIGLAGLAIDGGNAYSNKRHAQNAADTTSLAVALSLIRHSNDWSAAQADGLARAASNGFPDTDAELGSSTTVENTEIYRCNRNTDPNTAIAQKVTVGCGVYAGNSEYLLVSITANVRTYLASVIGWRQVTVRAEAVARAVPGGNKPLFGGNAVVSLSPNDCSSLIYAGSANVLIENSGIFVNSTCSDGAFQLNGSSPNTLTAPCMNSAGDLNPETSGGKIQIPSDCYNEGATTLGYPPQGFKPPNPDCGTMNATKSGNVLSPGWWDGAFPPNGIEYFQSGLYCIINGNFTLQGNVTVIGHDVTFYVRDGGVTWNGSTTIKFDAPDTGPFAGLLLYLPMSNHSTVSINGSGDSQFVGTILAPGSEIDVLGGGGAAGMQCQFVGYTVKLGGGGDTKIDYQAAKNFQPPDDPSVQQTK